MNCKPGQMATIVRPAITHQCVGKRLGSPVKVVRLVTPDSFMSALLEAVDGPMWEIECALSCPDPEPCWHGMDRVPDSCLKPMDEGSQPEPADVARPLVTEKA